MTTVVYRDGVMATDTAYIANGVTIVIGRRKIARRSDDGALIGGCGKSATVDAFIAWAVHGEIGDPPVMEEAAGIIAYIDGTIRGFDDDEGGGRRGFLIAPPYFAIGSGAEYAFGAMFAGADAETSVRAAIAHDKSTNGDVLILRHLEPKGA